MQILGYSLFDGDLIDCEIEDHPFMLEIFHEEIVKMVSEQRVSLVDEGLKAITPSILIGISPHHNDHFQDAWFILAERISSGQHDYIINDDLLSNLNILLSQLDRFDSTRCSHLLRATVAKVYRSAILKRWQIDLKPSLLNLLEYVSKNARTHYPDIISITDQALKQGLFNINSAILLQVNGLSSLSLKETIHLGLDIDKSDFEDIRELKKAKPNEFVSWAGDMLSDLAVMSWSDASPYVELEHVLYQSLKYLEANDILTSCALTLINKEIPQEIDALFNMSSRVKLLIWLSDHIHDKSILVFMKSYYISLLKNGISRNEMNTHMTRLSLYLSGVS